MEKSYKEIMPQITTFMFDVDGVLTNGLVHVSSTGELTRQMHTKDGYALKTAVDAGFNVCIISGGNNEGVRKRLEGLGITDIFLGAHDKIEQFKKYLQKIISSWGIEEDEKTKNLATTALEKCDHCDYKNPNVFDYLDKHGIHF